MAWENEVQRNNTDHFLIVYTLLNSERNELLITEPSDPEHFEVDLEK